MEKKRDSFFLSGKKGKDKKPGKQKQEVKKQDSPQQEFKKKRLNNFETHRNGATNGDSKNQKEKADKKPFDKKTYRLKKYSKRYKLEQWEEQRKKRLLREYQKSIQNDAPSGSYNPVSFDEDVTDANQGEGKFVRHPDLIEKENLAQKKKDPFSKAKEQYNKIKEDKKERQQEIEKAREEKKQKLQEYKKKKHERFRKLSKKTKKGQPVMTGRLELLLEKIQKTK